MQTADIYSVAAHLNEAAQILHFLRDGDLHQKAQACKEAGQYALERTYFPEALPILIELLEQEATPKLAEEAAWALWKFKDPRVIPVLLQKAKESKHLGVREKAIRSLGLMECKEALVYLRRLAVDLEESFVLRTAAVSALGYFEDKSLVSFLEKFLESDHPLLRKEAISSLGRFLRRDPGLSPEILHKVKRHISIKKEASGEVRSEALRLLSYGKEKGIRGLVEKAFLQDPSPKVRQTALVLLSQWIDEKIEAFFLKGLEDLSWSVRYTAAEMLVQQASQEKMMERTSIRLTLQKISKMIPSHIKAASEALELIKRF